MNIEAYLSRIGYSGPREATADTLRRLHLAHMYAVPFENLDIHWGRPISLETAKLFDKIVTRRRGGFCYELNGLFGALLGELGFRVHMLSAEVARADGSFSPAFDHLALAVEANGPWLADVGFGDGFLAPLRLDGTREQPQGEFSYRIDTKGDYRVLMRRDSGGECKAQYRFQLQPHALSEFAERCRFHQVSPESHFTQARLCTRATPQGRVTLSGMRLIETAAGVRTEMLLEDAPEYAAALGERFAVVE